MRDERNNAVENVQAHTHTHTQTNWEGGIYKCVLKFPSNYPANGPKVTFKPLIWYVKFPLYVQPRTKNPLALYYRHMNVYGSGDVCLDILSSRWKSSLTIKQILLGLQNLLDEPNPKSPANSQASSLYQRDRPAYNKKIKEQARKFTPSYASYSGGGGDDDDITIIE